MQKRRHVSVLTCSVMWSCSPGFHEWVTSPRKGLGYENWCIVHSWFTTGWTQAEASSKSSTYAMRHVNHLNPSSEMPDSARVGPSLHRNDLQRRHLPDPAGRTHVAGSDDTQRAFLAPRGWPSRLSARVPGKGCGFGRAARISGDPTEVVARRPFHTY